MHNHKNDYSCIAFFPDKAPKKWNYVHKLKGFFAFLDTSHKDWKYVNVYERRTGKYLKRFYPGNPYPNFLTIVLVLVACLLTASAASPIPLNSTFNKKTFISRSKKSYPKPLFTSCRLRFSAAHSDSFTFNNGFNNTATIQTYTPLKTGGLHE